MKLFIYTSLLILGLIIALWIVKDYQRRMVLVNANYQCNVAGIDEYCNYLIEEDMREGVK